MQLCDDGHGEVCFEGRNCPACTTIEKRDKTIERLEMEASDLQSEIDDLKAAQQE